MILHQCTRNYDQMFGCRVTAQVHRLLWANFSLFTPVGYLKIKTFCLPSGGYKN